MNRLRDVEMMTLSEFHYKRYAQQYKEIDELHNMHLSAFLNRNVSATKNVGTEKKPKEEYVYENFEDFFDYEKVLKQIDEDFTKRKEKTESINDQPSPAELAMNLNRKE
ncbi:hypothetical protein [Oceanobacillus timonensis]|uniref:hypothetical protein n=1 Tax=Oceanobacillus timonensis TaxID=1926285 RepID=UPI0009BA3C51|nr:hypothetical protein [Oceanobacillus timonensis]